LTGQEQDERPGFQHGSRSSLLRAADSRGPRVAFLRVLAQTQARVPLRLLAFCLMPNHWHLLLWPQADDELSCFMHWLTLTHTQRWLAHYHCVGSGHLYQGRFKSFPVAEDEHLLTVGRYVERNAFRAGLSPTAEAWRWGSLWLRRHPDAGEGLELSAWPVSLPDDWVRGVNEPQTDAELRAVRQCVQRGRPYGEEPWVQDTVARLQLGSTLRPQGRPRKQRPVRQAEDLFAD
jgi:putative transposase